MRRRGHITYAPHRRRAARPPPCRNPSRRGVAVACVAATSSSARRSATVPRKTLPPSCAGARCVMRSSCGCSPSNGSCEGLSSERARTQYCVTPTARLTAHSFREGPACREATRERLRLQPRQFFGRPRDSQVAADQTLDSSPHRDPAAVYAAIELCEGVGLWLLKRWGEYFAAVATAIFLRTKYRHHRQGHPRFGSLSLSSMWQPSSTSVDQAAIRDRWRLCDTRSRCSRCRKPRGRKLKSAS